MNALLGKAPGVPQGCLAQLASPLSTNQAGPVPLSRHAVGSTEVPQSHVCSVHDGSRFQHASPQTSPSDLRSDLMMEPGQIRSGVFASGGVASRKNAIPAHLAGFALTSRADGPTRPPPHPQSFAASPAAEGKRETRPRSPPEEPMGAEHIWRNPCAGPAGGAVGDGRGEAGSSQTDGSI